MFQPTAPAGTLHAAHAALATCVTSTGGSTVCSGSSFGAVFSVILLVDLAFIVLGIVATVKVVTKAGYSGWWVLITLVPLVNVVMMLVFAFSKWPVVREVEMLRARAVGPGGYGSPPGWGGGWGPGGTGFGGPPFGPSPAFGPGQAPGASVPTAGPGGSPAPAPGAGQGPPFETHAGGPMPGAVPPGTPAGPVGRAPVESEAPLPSFWEYEPGATGPKSGSGTPGTPPAANPAAGWYPTADGRQRYWDGMRWTDHFS